MTPDKKIVCLFYNNLSDTFSIRDLLSFAGNYKKVIVFSSDKPVSVDLPPNVSLIVINDEAIRGERLNKMTISDLFYITLLDLFTKGTSINYFKNIKSNLSLLKYSLKLSQLISKSVAQNIEPREIKNCLFLSFWMNEWCTALAYLKARKVIKGFSTRAHGRDLFEEREPITGKLPFRIFQLKLCDAVFSISGAGTKYLKDRYPEFSDKIHKNYLGSKDFKYSERKLNKHLTICSVAHVRNIKRLFLIAEALQKVNFHVKWIHIGAENKSAKDKTTPRFTNALEKLKENHFVETSFTGALSELEVINTLKINNVELLVSVSETEGLPVTMMECISLGIPILATDVGGCKEVINKENGLVLPKEFPEEQLIGALLSFNQNRIYWLNQSDSIRKYWEDTFNSNLCQQSFYNRFNQL